MQIFSQRCKGPHLHLSLVCFILCRIYCFVNCNMIEYPLSFNKNRRATGKLKFGLKKFKTNGAEAVSHRWNNKTIGKSIQDSDWENEQRCHHTGYGTVEIICAGSRDPSSRRFAPTADPPTNAYHGQGSKQLVKIGDRTSGYIRRIKHVYIATGRNKSKKLTFYEILPSVSVKLFF